MNRRNFLLSCLGAIGAIGAMGAGGGAWFLNQPKFGRPPQGERLKRILASPHFADGSFQCLEPISFVADPKDGPRGNMFTILYKFIFGDRSAFMPKEPMISVKTDLKSLPLDEDLIVWMGHSTYYMQLGGRRILTDPVFSSYASPVSFVNKAFPGSNIYTADDIPPLDILAITHDHWDHLDYPTIMALKPKIKDIVCPLGVGEYFEQWGFSPSVLHEEDWFTEIKLGDNFSVHIMPSQHFSGRFLKRNGTLWCGMAFVTPGRRVYLSGDGGYGKHFKTIGEQFGGFDLAIMENGQYNKKWSKIHLLPAQTAQAAADVGAKVLLNSHNGKFALSEHSWKEPYEELAKAVANYSYQWLTPKIGELVHIGKSGQHFEHWWESMN